MSNLTLKEQLAALTFGSLPSASENTKKPKKPHQYPAKNSGNNLKSRPAWLEHAQYGVELLKAHFPACFKEMAEIQPLKIGIKQDLVIKLGSKENIVLNDKACMVSSLSYYVSSAAYHKHVVAGATRIDLDGHPAGIVTEEEARYSTQCRQAKLQKKVKTLRKVEPVGIGSE